VRILFFASANGFTKTNRLQLVTPTRPHCFFCIWHRQQNRAWWRCHDVYGGSGCWRTCLLPCCSSVHQGAFAAYRLQGTSLWFYGSSLVCMFVVLWFPTRPISPPVWLPVMCICCEMQRIAEAWWSRMASCLPEPESSSTQLILITCQLSIWECCGRAHSCWSTSVAASAVLMCLCTRWRLASLRTQLPQEPEFCAHAVVKGYPLVYPAGLLQMSNKEAKMQV